MTQSEMTDQLVRAEGLLAARRDAEADELLSRLASDAEEYVDRNCETTADTQWFAFPSIFERLAYRRVEKDPRALRDVGEPLDRLYADLGFACVGEGDYARAIEALKSAVRWNPMGCGYRLDLAELFRTTDDLQEHLALTFSVFERASDARHLARAYANFARWYHDADRPELEAAVLRCGLRLGCDDAILSELAQEARGGDADPSSISDERADELMGGEGIPSGANAEIAICLLMCATDAATDGDRALATNLTLRARDLVGEKACAALLELIHASDADLEAEGGDSHAQA
jgi:tetratricopeptide (TPR) repeat protein